MRRHIRLSAAVVALILLFTLSACRQDALIVSSSEVIPEASLAEPVSSEVSSAALSSSDAVPSAAHSSEAASSEASSQEVSSSKAAASSKATSSKAVTTSSKTVTSSKATTSSKTASSGNSSKGSYVGMKETLTTDSGYSSTSTSSGTNAEPYFYQVYQLVGTGIATFHMQSGGSCKINRATLTGVNSSKSGATASVSFSETTVTVSPNAIGSYYISIKVEDPTNGTTYTFETTVEVS